MQEEANGKPEANGRPKAIPAAQKIKAPQQTIFIPADKLGVMEHLVRELPQEPTKRKRQIEFNRLEHVVKGLKLIPWHDEILAISFGCLRSGAPGMFVSHCITQTQIVDLPQGEPNVDQR